MSRGPGKVERVILNLFDNESDASYSTEDLIDRVYPGLGSVEKKHRVSVLRAAKRACERLQGWYYTSSVGLGGTVIFYSIYNVMSYATMRAKADINAHYRSNDPRVRQSQIKGPEEIAAMFAEGGRHYDYVVDGGAWWRHVQINIIERDGIDNEGARVLIAAQQRDNRRFDALLGRAPEQ